MFFLFNFYFSVLTDSISNILSISDAGWVIHFDVPSQVEIFGDRLWCQRKYFELYEGAKLTVSSVLRNVN